MRPLAFSLCTAALLACDGTEPPPGPSDHGPMAEGIYAELGAPAPYATPAQLETFERGRAVALHRFSRAEGLGPAFNVTFCASCHERPTTGGSAGLYRNFFLTGVRTPDGAFIPGMSAGSAGGVIRLYAYGDEHDARPGVPEATNVVAQRNPIPFFGVGLLAELSDAELLRRADPDDRDGDGISGRPNYDRGFVGRFGRKAQTVSIEGFIRGPLFNHLGITSDPLSDAQRAELPVDSSATAAQGARLWLVRALEGHAQAAAPDGPLTDDDEAPDPELSTEELFDLVSFAMLLGAPELEPLTDHTERGRDAFDAVGCAACHTPRLEGPRGPLPVYSDLLLHDMGPKLADGLVAKDATGSEFRTQPLWGLRPVGPYLHDGRASTVHDAIRAHGGEGERARRNYERLQPEDQEALVAFLHSLGGAAQYSPGLLPPDTPLAPVGTYGGPARALSDDERDRFVAGRALFDREFGFSEGAGGPRLNGDSCRACHFEPVLGGAGPRGVNVTRHGILDADGAFTPPAVGTILHRSTAVPHSANRAQPEANVFEHRQTPHLFGLGLIEGIDEAEILARADADDTSPPDGISGRPSFTDGARLGRFGWKAQVPTIDEFVRDAFAAELGMTLPYEEGQTFGRLQDNDAVPDPELDLEQAHLLGDYLRLLGPPPRAAAVDPGAEAAGALLFETVGCALCHVPELAGADGPVPLYSDLLLHEILAPGAPGIEDASAATTEFRTAPLWGLATTAPYLHSGEADTIEEAIELHDGEGSGARDAFEALTPADRDALLAFLATL